MSEKCSDASRCSLPAPLQAGNLSTEVQDSEGGLCTCTNVCVCVHMHTCVVSITCVYMHACVCVMGAHMSHKARERSAKLTPSPAQHLQRPGARPLDKRCRSPVSGVDGSFPLPTILPVPWETGPGLACSVPPYCPSGIAGGPCQGPPGPPADRVPLPPGSAPDDTTTASIPPSSAVRCKALPRGRNKGLRSQEPHL